MARTKFDGVIEAVRYSAEGKIDVVRVYKKRWLVFSDGVLIKRDELLEQLKDGKGYVAGQRKPFGGNLFVTGKQLHLTGNGNPFITTKEGHHGVGLTRVDTLMNMYGLGWSLESEEDLGTRVLLEVGEAV